VVLEGLCPWGQVDLLELLRRVEVLGRSEEDEHRHV
jgi:hypothetical protein